MCPHPTLQTPHVPEPRPQEERRLDAEGFVFLCPSLLPLKACGARPAAPARPKRCALRSGPPRAQRGSGGLSADVPARASSSLGG